ncbi:hypothetical protein [Cytophaga aurantiaca]|uniref:hypothetical protein n=1 Tax=Cytophaga aurantiaca TaxID=29530 RepID=UPI00036D7D11|nr:hypothetical protein [Cytophaga aurantiaca]
MYRILFLILFLGTTYISGAQNKSSYLKAERYTFPETGFSIQAPQHFDTTYMYKGLLHKATSSSLVATKAANRNPIAFNQGLTKEYFSTQNLTLIKSEKIVTSKWNGVLYYLSFEVKNVKMQRMMLVTGTYNDTYILMANFPEMFASQLTVPIRESMLTLLF